MADQMPQNEPTQQADQTAARQRKRSIAIAIVLAILVAVFYGLTIVKMGPGLFNRSL